MFLCRAHENDCSIRITPNGTDSLMQDWILIMVTVAYGYLIGSIPSAYLMGRWTKGIDIRQYGSGNVGASNARNHFDKVPFVTVAAFDSLFKGTVTIGLTQMIGLDLWYQVTVALVTAVGHNWSVFIKFSGGRGLGVAMGALLLLSWKLLVLLLAIGVIGGFFFRSYGLWFGIAILLLPFGAMIVGSPDAMVWYGIGVCGVTVLKRLTSNPGTSPQGLRWRDKLAPRLLFDRDTWDGDGWVARTPSEPKHRNS